MKQSGNCKFIEEENIFKFQLTDLNLIGSLKLKPEYTE